MNKKQETKQKINSKMKDLITLNVNGLNTPIKRQKLLATGRLEVKDG